MKTTNSGLDWSDASHGLPAREIDTLAADRLHPGTLYAGAYPGLHKTTDGGATWTPTGLTTGFVKHLIVDPQNGDVLYSIREENVFCTQPPYTCTAQYLSNSTDAGATWTSLDKPAFLYSTAIDPSTPSTLYGGGRGVIYKSTDGGHSWTGAFEGLPFTPIYAVAVDPWRPSVLYAGTNVGVYRSPDGGIHWSPTDMGATDPRVNRLAVNPWYPGIVYAATPTGVSVLHQH
jgi:hypothetical protein